jgi:hypothetical protein
VLLEEKRKRAKVNRRMLHVFKVGAKVKAIYEDEDNDPAVRATTFQKAPYLGVLMSDPRSFVV